MLYLWLPVCGGYTRHDVMGRMLCHDCRITIQDTFPRIPALNCIPSQVENSTFAWFPATKGGKEIHLGDHHLYRESGHHLLSRYKLTYPFIAEMLSVSKVQWRGVFTDEKGEPASEALHSAMLSSVRIQTFPGGSLSKCQRAVRELQAREALGVFGPFQPCFKTTYGFGLLASEPLPKLTLLTVYGGALLKSGKSTFVFFSCFMDSTGVFNNAICSYCCRRGVPFRYNLGPQC